MPVPAFVIPPCPSAPLVPFVPFVPSTPSEPAGPVAPTAPSFPCGQGVNSIVVKSAAIALIASSKSFILLLDSKDKGCGR